MKQLERTQHNIKLITNGRVLETHRGIKAFKLFGHFYTTNQNRVLSGKGIYKFDDKSWKLTDKGIFYKLKTIIIGEAYKFTS